ncbi:hypothetical protein [Streptomyces sp. NPDC059651]|uniref:hypothetical protein n=1 Tax=Streptomyces sp. NPDC059651 TaxID=3346897 RepID=UPI0036CB62B3
MNETGPVQLRAGAAAAPRERRGPHGIALETAAASRSICPVEQDGQGASAARTR